MIMGGGGGGAPAGGRVVPIEEGMTVRQKQPLFFLPDLSEMEVTVALNESVVDRVSVGQRARARFEALPNLVLDGRVEAISQIPVTQSPQGEDIRYFMCLVYLDKVAPGLVPGMTARVDIALGRREHVLAIPHQAVQVDGGRKICYVAHDEALERREVKTGQDTSELIEVTDGLEEGELVALNPPSTGKHVEPLLNFDEIDLSRPP
jgi:HlyD family secretion protein